MGKGKKNRKSLKTLIDEVLNVAEQPSLANPALATHTVLMFAIDNLELFTEWVNEGASGADDEPKTAEELAAYLKMLHNIVDAAVEAAHMIRPGMPTPFMPGVHIMHVPRSQGSEELPPDVPGMYL